MTKEPSEDSKLDRLARWLTDRDDESIMFIIAVSFFIGMFLSLAVFSIGALFQ